MKKTLFLFGLLLLASCSEKEEFGNMVEEGAVIMSVEDYIWSEPQTRTSATVSTSGIAFNWVEGDTVAIYPSAGDVVSFPITTGANSNNATFSGGAWALRKDYTYTAFYPFEWKRRQANSIVLDYSGQTGDLEKIGEYDYIYAEGVNQAGGNAQFTFHHIGAIVRLVISTEKKRSRINLSSEEAIFPQRVTVDLTSGQLVFTNVDYTKRFVIDETIPAGESKTLYIEIPPCDLSSKVFTICGEQVQGKNFESGKAYSYTITTTKPDDPEDFDYVDLELPSGLKWATCNLGASVPEESGYYFAWGETEPKNTYTTATYKWYDATSKKYTKYCTASANGTVDNRTMLDANDDAAFANCGAPWRMPTISDVNELIEVCDWRWTGSGWKVIGPNGNSIFFPLSGRYKQTGLTDKSSGFLWLSNLGTTDNCANHLNLNWFGSIPEYQIVDDYSYRYYGMQIRPVRP